MYVIFHIHLLTNADQPFVEKVLRKDGNKGSIFLINKN